MVRERSRGGGLPADAKSPEPSLIHSAGHTKVRTQLAIFTGPAPTATALPSSRREQLRGYPEVVSLLRVPCAFSLPPQSIGPNKRAYPPSPSLSHRSITFSLSLHFSLRPLRAFFIARCVLLSPVRLSTIRARGMPREVNARRPSRLPSPTPPPPLPLSTAVVTTVMLAIVVAVACRAVNPARFRSCISLRPRVYASDTSRYSASVRAERMCAPRRENPRGRRPAACRRELSARQLCEMYIHTHVHKLIFPACLSLPRERRNTCFCLTRDPSFP